MTGTFDSGIFHLAIPVDDLAAARDFYSKLGCRVAREYDDRITIVFFGHQLVCHLSPDGIDPKPVMYPRHFGITLHDREAFDALWSRARERGIAVFQEPMTRFEGKPEEHATFFLVDPSNNLIEFKYYNLPEMMY